jgi:hypothetical protein
MSTISSLPLCVTSYHYRIVCGEPDRIIDEAMDRNPQPWFDEVMCHGDWDGTPTPIIDGKRVRITPEQMAAFIRSWPAFGHRPIRLLTCWAGARPDGFAQQLANLLRLPILAPPGPITAADFVGLDETERFCLFMPE